MIFLICLLTNCGVLFLNKPSGQNGISLWILGLLGIRTTSSAAIQLDRSIPDLKKGEEVEVGIILTSIPSANVDVEIASSSTILTVNGSTSAKLTFAPEKYNIRQAITFKAVLDDKSENGISVVTLTSSLGEKKNYTVNISATNTQRILAYNVPDSMEEGKIFTLRVKLGGNPVTQNTTIAISSSDPSRLSAKPSTFTFTASNYSTEQDIVITSLVDADSATDNIYLKLSGSGLTNLQFPLQIIDGDISPVFTPSIGNTFTNGAGSQVIQVSLSGNPTVDRTVNLQFSDASQLSASPNTLNFTSTNWNTPQTVTVTAIASPTWASGTVTLSAGASGIKSGTIDFTTTNTVPGNITFSNITAQIIEGQSGTMQVVLDKQPTANLTVALTSSDPRITLSPSLLVFTPAGYSLPKTVNLLTNNTTPYDDSINVTLGATATGYTAASGNTLLIATGTKILFTNLPTSMGDLANSSFTVTLSGNPGIPRTITLNSSNSVLTIGSTTLVFNSANYNTPQSVSYTSNLGALTPPIASNVTATTTLLANTLRVVNVYKYGGQLTKTGQTTCYDISGNGISCAGTGQDGEIQAGVTASFTGPTTNAGYPSDYITIDNNTGLVWVACSFGSGGNTCGGQITNRSWNTMVSDCSTLNPGSGFAGITNWRLPTLNELFSIYNFGNASPAAYNTAFPSSYDGYYASSDTSLQDTNKFHFVVFSNVNNIPLTESWSKTKSDTGVSMAYRCVSSSNALTKTYLDNGDQTIVDVTTGLTWTKCALGLSGSSCTIGTVNTYTWNTQSTACSSLNLGGKSWRVPNARELQSIVDVTYQSPPHNPTYFPGTYGAATSTSKVNIFFSILVINSLGNFYVQEAKTSAFPLRCVTGP